MIKIIQGNKLIRFIAIILAIIVLILAFFSSYDSLKIDNLAFVIALAIDKADKSDNLKITFQIAKPASMSESSSQKGSTATINTVETSSVGAAINLMNSYVEKQLNFSHCKIIVFSEAVAVDGISKEIYTLMNNIQIRPSTNIVISKTDAKSYIENSSTNLEILPTKYYEVFPNSSKYTGYISNSTIGDFFNSLNSDISEPSGILGGLVTSDMKKISDYAPEDPLDFGNMKSNQSSIYGERGSENIGLAVFKDDKMIGELNAMETVCFSIISGRISTFFITIEDPQNVGNYIDLYLYQNYYTNPKVNIINESPYITIDCKLERKNIFNGR